MEDTPDEARFRAEVAAFMREHAASYGPSDGRMKMDDRPAYAAASRAWQATLGSAGWGAPTWPIAHGGRGFGPNESRIFREEQGRYAVPLGMTFVSIQMVGPTLIAHGTEQQRARFLQPMLHGEHLWCQLFSEPDAGSDLASLRTRAVRDGDEWVVSGQKVWTSGARTADFGILLARTDPDAPSHDGITYFLLDMHSPGIEVRPLMQINRAAHFNEVFLHEVRLPLDSVVGEVGEGWRVARSTLASERSGIGSIDLDQRVWALAHAARAAATIGDPGMRDALAAAWIHTTVVRLTSERVLAAVRTGGMPGPEASVLKLGVSTALERVGNLAMRAGGAGAMLAGDGPEGFGPLQDAFLSQWASRIGGGTEQIQRNLIGERALGLPREPR